MDPLTLSLLLYVLVYPPVIKHGVLEDRPLLSDVPMKISISRDFPASHVWWHQRVPKCDFLQFCRRTTDPAQNSPRAEHRALSRKITDHPIWCWDEKHDVPGTVAWTILMNYLTSIDTVHPLGISCDSRHLPVFFLKLSPTASDY